MLFGVAAIALFAADLPVAGAVYAVVAILGIVLVRWGPGATPEAGVGPGPTFRAPGSRSAGPRDASIVSSTVRRTVVSSELRTTALMARATAVIDTLSGASQRL